MPKSRKTTNHQTSNVANARMPAKASKSAKIVALLKREQGATLKELMKVTKWQAHSVRGFLSGTVKKKMALEVASAQRDSGDRVYRVS